MDSSDLAYAGLVRQAELVRNGDVSPRELVDASLERIARLDPGLNAFRVVFHDRARAEADQAAARVKAGEDRPLLGVPVAVKDNVDVAGEVTTHGTGAFSRPAREDAEVVKRLRAAGAVIVGKTHMPEFAVWPSTQSATYGASVNPWHGGYSPGGSSGGSATAVAAGMVPLAHASDGAGSIRAPAASTALFGLKPTRGRVSLLPDRSHWHGLSVYGALTRSVADTALFLDAIAGAPANNPGEPGLPAPERPYLETAERADPGKLRIAVSTKLAVLPAKLDPQQRQAHESTAALLRDLGHDVVERDPDYGTVPLQLLFASRYLRGALDDIAKAEHPERLEKRVRGLGRIAKVAAPEALLQRALRDAEPWTQNVLRLWNDVDVLLVPTLPRLPARLNEQEGMGTIRMMNSSTAFVSYCVPWNISGQPAASIPAGWTADGVPLAVQVVGRPGDESTLIALAAQLEQARPWADRRPPLAP